MNLPIRELGDDELLWRASVDGITNFIATDHVPHILGEKGRGYLHTSSGMPGVKISLPLTGWPIINWVGGQMVYNRGTFYPEIRGTALRFGDRKSPTVWSIIWAIANNSISRQRLPTICNPMGSPACVNLVGMTTAEWPLKLNGMV